jgi:light-regulated signal transduction histidine kinase (bacteriophytochrome)
MVAGALVFAYELHRYNAMLRQMRIIAEMNHHIRNALQPILYSAYLKEQTQQIRMIEQGTERIQWALREILPGQFQETPSWKDRTDAA